MARTQVAVAEPSAFSVERFVNGLVVLVASLIVLGIEFLKPYYTRDFVELDPDLSRPLVEQTVSGLMLMGFSLVLPLVVLTMVQKGGHLRVGGGSGRLLLGVLLRAFLVGMLVQFFAVDFLKTMCGRLRPNFFALCNYKGYAAVDLTNTSTQAWASYLQRTAAGRPGSFEYCETTDDNSLFQAHLSFPSGHTSFSFGGLGFTGLVLRAAAKDRDLPESLQLLALLLPMLLAAWIGSTRVRDYWHREDDVAVGGAIGLAAAGWAYYTLLPPLFKNMDLQAPTLVEEMAGPP